jgi:hypothetical protein
MSSRLSGKCLPMECRCHCKDCGPYNAPHCWRHEMSCHRGCSRG